jgi:calcineurin-like phosphoesterase family protein
MGSGSFIRVRHRKLWLVPIVAALVCAAAALVVLGSYQSRSAQAQTSSAVVVGAGDIASCTSKGDTATARLLANISGTVLAIGDNAYGEGTTAQFNNCYDPTWGQFKARTQPVVGNHEYRTNGAAGYFNYFGAGKDYYSYDRGAWHIIALNSECDYWATGFKDGPSQCSSQKQQNMIAWLKNDLANNPTACTLAYFHQPRFSSGQGGNALTATEQIWEALYAADAEVVLSGHDHIYERFAPQAPGGRLDTAQGIRQFVVGSGGVNHGRIGNVKPNSQVRNATAFGVLKLTLNSGSYAWKFVPEAGKSFTDSGTDGCH